MICYLPLDIFSTPETLAIAVSKSPFKQINEMAKVLVSVLIIKRYIKLPDNNLYP